MKVVVLTSRFPYPLEKGDKLRIYHQLRELATRHQVILVSLCLRTPSDSEKAIIDKIVDKQYVFCIPRWKRILAVVMGFFRGRPFRNSYFYNSSVQSEIDALITEHNPEHIYCHLIRMAEYVRSQPISKTLDYMDCFSAGAKKRMQVSKGLEAWFFKKEYQFTADYEADVFQDFDHHTIISFQDQEDMRVRDRSKIQIIKNGIDLNYFKTIQSSKEYDIGFIGNLGYHPNVEASIYLAEEIMPLLPSNTKAVLAGARPTPAVLKLASGQIKVTGWVEDIRTVYASIYILAAPLFNGIGLQNKILEAMAMGVPVITTSLVNNAIGATPIKEILIADTPEAFVRAFNQLKSDKAFYKRVSEQALNFVRQNYSWEKVSEPFLDLIES